MSLQAGVIEPRETLPLLGVLPKGWRVAQFGDLTRDGCHSGIYKGKEFRGRGDKLVNMGELFANPRLLSIPMDRLALTEGERERFGLKAGDLLFARRSLVAEGAGKCSIVLRLDEPTTFESSIIRARPDVTKASDLFLFYLFQSDYGKHVLDTIRRQTAVAGITGRELATLRLPVPPLAEQRAIARVLGSLDDKIELNRRMNSTLEQIAQALFKSWFVDFDPVRAKAEGRWKKGESLPGMPADMWDLWPSEFEESEIGEIPKGWEVAGLLDIASLLSGGTPSTEEPSYWGAGIPWVSGKDVSAAQGSFILRTERTVSEGGVANSATKRLPARTVVITARGTVGALAILASEMCISQTNYGLKAADGVGDDFLFFTVRSAIDELQQESYGTIFDTITTWNLRGTRVVRPPRVVLARFEREVEPLMQRVLSNLREARSLSATRDALLPKLLSGEIRVPVDGGK